ncbi:ROK family protein [Alicyclobacillus cycloheptanicus]|uniref:NBD/HSP70 family sugar kinase n=1 Tax=Alicyclobacillus cycloheptanicus TaxID=1457 RepID=A0ABT9XMA2_9BACL|nr:ROK family protein [Alicyclobacillus cycloheptanicus]MDQ0191422.1 putative NBD/HSP70 family sugar kinase [Alicyclobacillus cycloheptanicus]WDM02136.1 ROK family protein [Alicyclobacillus cycloheptanicus]
MSKTMDSTAMRQVNKKLVTQLIYERSPVSRISVSQMTGLNKATVSSLVDDLIRDQYVIEVGYGRSRRGRKPVMLEFNAKAGYCIGVNVQITYVTTVLTDLMGQIVHKHVRPIDFSQHQFSAAELKHILLTEIDAVAAKAPASPHGIIGAGIALPGMVNFETGLAYYLPNIEITEWDVCQALSKHLTFPVFIDNDGNCGALSAYRAHPSTPLVFVNVGIGVGTGIVIDGEVFRGYKGIAGEFGHMTISTIGLLCRCGNYGCWEQYASEQALLRYLQERGQMEASADLESQFAQIVVERAVQGDVHYQEALTTLGGYLGIGIANIANGVNPERIVIGGPIAAGAAWLRPAIRSVLRHRSILSNKDVEIDFAEEDAVVSGAARLCIAHLIL